MPGSWLETRPAVRTSDASAQRSTTLLPGRGEQRPAAAEQYAKENVPTTQQFIWDRRRRADPAAANALQEGLGGRVR